MNHKDILPVLLASDINVYSMARAFHEAWPEAVIALPPGLQAFESAYWTGRQWFSVSEMGEDDRPERIAAAMPGFVALIRQIQTDSLVPPTDTVIVGFSQGAMMALHVGTALQLLALADAGLWWAVALAIFTGWRSAVFQPRRFQPWIHSAMPFWTYWLSVCSSTLQGLVSISSAWIAAISSMRLLVVCASPPTSSRSFSP